MSCVLGFTEKPVQIGSCRMQFSSVSVLSSHHFKIAHVICLAVEPNDKLWKKEARWFCVWIFLIKIGVIYWDIESRFIYNGIYIAKCILLHNQDYSKCCKMHLIYWYFHCDNSAFHWPIKEFEWCIECLFIRLAPLMKSITVKFLSKVFNQVSDSNYWFISIKTEFP